MEKRAYGRRAELNAGATVQSGSRRFQARIVDLGIGGMAIETKPEVSLERFLRVQVRLTPEAPPLDLDAIVRRREKRGEAVRWGVELVDPPPSTLARIEEWLDRQGAPAQATATEEAAKVDPAQSSHQDPELHGLFQSALAALDL